MGAGWCVGVECWVVGMACNETNICGIGRKDFQRKKRREMRVGRIQREFSFTIS